MQFLVVLVLAIVCTVCSSPDAALHSECSSPDKFMCKTSGHCISMRFKCDGELDCGANDASDEEECFRKFLNFEDCPDENEFRCKISRLCLPINYKCDEEGDCGPNDFSDEDDCPSNITEIDEGCSSKDVFMCKTSGICLPISVKCDGKHDCGALDISDEDGCSSTKPFVIPVMGETSLDWMLDKTVKIIFQKGILAKNQDRVVISDFDTEISGQMFGIPFRSVLSAKTGTVKDMSTLVRVLPVDIRQNQEANSTTISGLFVQRDFQITYENFTSEVFGSKTEGAITAFCAGNNLILNITSRFISDTKCESTLDFVNMTTIGRCSVRLETTTYNTWFRGYSFSYFLNNNSQKISDELNSQIKSILEPIVRDNVICNFIKFMGLFY